MIVPLGNNLRKWLLALAVAARHGVQSVVAALESVQEKEVGPEIAPGGSKKAIPGGPPDHWVQLVERHAPELLQSGPPKVVSRSPSPLPDRAAGLDRSDPEDARELKPDRVLSAKGDQSRFLASPRAPQEYDRLNRKQESPAQVHPGQAGDNNRTAGAGAKSSNHIRDDAATLDPAAARPGSARSGRSSAWPEGGEKTMHRPALDREKADSFFPAREPDSKSRAAESSNNNTMVSRGFPSTGVQVENQLAGTGEPKSIKAPRPTVRRIEPIYPKESGSSEDSAVDARMPTPEKIEQEAGLGTPPGPVRFSRETASVPNTGGQSSASLIPAGKESVMPVSDARITSGQHHADVRRAGEKDIEKIMPQPEHRWPGLPGEEESEDVRGADLPADWPDLPEKQSAEATSLSSQKELYRTTAGSRDMGRLRRLDEEQRGRSWSESHF